MSAEEAKGSSEDALQREVVVLRQRVAELQRAAARHEDTAGISLAEREELLREAERVAHLGTWTWDLSSGRVTWSEEMFRILGLEPTSVTPSVETFFAAVHPDDRARARAAGDQSVRDGVLPLIDCRIVRPDGSIRHTTHSSSMLFDAQGTIRRIVGGVLDRTGQLEVETRLRRTLELLEEAQRFAKLGSWRMALDGHKVEWSHELRRIMGLPADAEPSIDLFMQSVVQEDHASSDRDRMLELFAKGGEHETRLRRPDGQLRHVRITLHRVTGPNGVAEMRGTILDVTDQVRMREELVHTQKMEAVGRLAGGLAHDFNNLLTVVTANLELLGHRIGRAPELDSSLQALSSAASLTRRLLAYGRKAQLSLKPVSPNVFVRSTSVLLERLVGDEVRLELDLGASLPQVQIDTVAMERALVNLVANARDAMPAGGVVRIQTSTRRVDGSLKVEISVADEGIGIDAADRPYLFEPFFTTRAGAGGTGLGLATVLGTAEQHGGTVRVDGRPGGGSIFTIVLPALDGVMPSAAESEPLEGPTTLTHLRKLNLLVIDDDIRVADVIRRMLEHEGHQVTVVTQPRDALPHWAEHGRATDLVICDVAMASMRGPELMAQLAQHGPRPRVLFITGYSQEAAQSTLGHPVLAKPFSADALRRAILAALDP